MAITRRLELITPANIDAALEVKVRPDQERFVAPVVKSLAEAYVHPEAWPRLIVDGDQVVGFVMGFFDIQWDDDNPGDVRSGLWRLNIADGHQGKGYGSFAVEQIAEQVRLRGGDSVYVTWEPAEDGPEQFYLKLGFEPTGEVSGGQRVGVLRLS